MFLLDNLTSVNVFLCECAVFGFNKSILSMFPTSVLRKGLGPIIQVAPECVTTCRAAEIALLATRRCKGERTSEELVWLDDPRGINCKGGCAISGLELRRRC